MAEYFFTGIGGSGMSSIAQVLAARGQGVSGSDRNFDRGLNSAFFDSLRSMGIRLFPQDGSGVTAGLDALVVSTAIEKTVPDYARGVELGIPVRHRAQMLAELFNATRGIAVGGTSGKSTVCGMVGVMLESAGLDPSIINGGRMKNFSTDALPGNARAGASDFMVIESDESDGSIVNYFPEISIVTNITLDHKTIEELIALFETFIAQTSGTAVLNADCPLVSKLNLSGRNAVWYGFSDGAQVRAESVETGPFSSKFMVDGEEFGISVPGMHNVSNALAAVAVGKTLGLGLKTIAEGLASFKGIARRFDLVGEARGVKVIDDFGHNPDKIRATLTTLDSIEGARLCVFQPHGFGPTKFMKQGLIDVFTTCLRAGDELFMPEIFYAGGTADTSISSKDIIDEIVAGGVPANYFKTRAEIAGPIAAKAKPGDVIVVMGARDDTLTNFCSDILKELEK